MKRRVISLLVLLFPLLASLGWLFSVDWETKVSTNVMDLIPGESPDPELTVARNIVATVFADRVSVLLRGVSDEAALRVYTSTLEASPLIDAVVDVSQEPDLEAAGEFIFENRLLLLFPQWLENASADLGGKGLELLANYAVAQLESELERADAFVLEEIIPADPLLLIAGAVNEFTELPGPKTLPEGTFLLEVKLAVSALEKKGQAPVFEVFASALRAAQVHSPKMTAVDSGANRFAAETEKRMREEVRWLNISTFVAVLLICVVLCRRPQLVVHVFFMLTVSLVLTVAAMTLLFERVNVFALVFGCVLCGVIVDYGLHAYLHETTEGERKLKTFLKPFLISSGSTLVGFLVLVFSELPVLQQMGVFVSCGLALSIGVTLVYVFGFLRKTEPLMTARMITRGPDFLVWLLPALALGSVFVLPTIEWEDDIRSLKYPLPELEAQEAEVRSFEGEAHQVFLTMGNSYAGARANLERFDQWLQSGDVPERAVLSAEKWIPDLEEMRAGVEFTRRHPEFGERLVAALESGGFVGSEFADFVGAWNTYASIAKVDDGFYNRLVATFSNTLEGQMAHLVGSSDGVYWWVTLLQSGDSLGQLPPGLHSIRLDQIESLSNVLARYRNRTMSLSLWAGAAIFCILVGVFRMRIALVIISVPVVGACVSASTLYLWSGSLGIFHLIGMFLGACLVLDYSVFSWIGCREIGRVPFSVAVSAMTTGVSFFILGLCNVPSIQAIGLAVFSVTVIGTILNYAFVPRIEGRISDNG